MGFDIIYDDNYITVRDSGHGLIDISIKKDGPNINTSIKTNIPPYLKGICAVLGCDKKGLEQQNIEDVKVKLKEIYVKKNIKKK